MDKDKLENMLINIENSVSIITKELGNAVVKNVLHKYDAKNIYELSPIFYDAVFSELYAIEVDLK